MPLGAGGKRVDFNGDGFEDILWRYYGTGGYNRVWFLGSAEGGAQPLGAADPGMTSVAPGRASEEPSREADRRRPAGHGAGLEAQGKTPRPRTRKRSWGVSTGGTWAR